MIGIEFRDLSSPVLLPAFTAIVDFKDFDVNALCRELSVEPVSSFLDRFNFDAVNEDEESTWYSASIALETFRSLRAHVENNSDILATEKWADTDVSRADFVNELKKCETLLEERVDSGDIFHLIVIMVIPDGVL